MTATDEKRVIDAAPKGLFIGGKWRDSSSGKTLAIEDPSTEQSLCAIADGPLRTRRRARCRMRRSGSWAATPPRDRGEILRRTFELMNERVDDLALLMTLEMGKPLAESQSEIAYASEFIRWYSEQAVRIDGRYCDEPERRGPTAHDEAADRALPADHAVELPDRDGHSQDRSGGRGRLHDGRQAGAADAAVDVRARRDHERGGPARRRTQRHDLEQRQPRHRAAVRRLRGCARCRSPGPRRSARS